jgi:hypothetical protein
VVYPGEDVDTALALLMESADAELRNAVIEAKQQRVSAHSFSDSL